MRLENEFLNMHSQWPSADQDGSNGDTSQDNRWVGGFLNNSPFKVKLGDHHSSEGTLKVGCIFGFGAWAL